MIPLISSRLVTYLESLFNRQLQVYAYYLTYELKMITAM